MAFLPRFVAAFICLTILSSGTKAVSLDIKQHKTAVGLKHEVQNAYGKARERGGLRGLNAQRH